MMEDQRMGEARRRKLTGDSPPRQTDPLSRADAITYAMEFLAATEDETWPSSPAWRVRTADRRWAVESQRSGFHGRCGRV